MVQKASRAPSQSDRLRQQGSSIKTLHGLNRLRMIPAVISVGGSNTQQAAGGTQAAAGNYLHTGGDTMIGPIAFYPVDVIISSGVIDIGEGVSTPPDFSTYVLVTPQTNPDDLDQIKGVGFSGQYLILQGTASQTINIRNYTASANGNIITPDGNTLTVTGANVITLIFDVTVSPNSFNGGWRVIQGSGGSGITFPIKPPVNDQGSAWATPYTINLANNTAHVTKFILDQNLTIQFSNPPTSSNSIWFPDVGGF